jgi:enoyl-CoA hydratase
MAERQFVKTSVEEHIAVLTIDHPPANALDIATLTDLDAAFDEAAADDSVKIIILTGAGQFAFCAGADINIISAIKGPDDAREMVLRGQTIYNKIAHLRKPVIAAINSVCLGGGLELALVCHMRIASDRARFGLTEINLGLISGFGGTQRLPRLVGKAKALEMMLTGDMIPAQEAYRIGLINKIVPEGEVVKAARDLAKRIAARGQVAVRLIIDAVQQGSEMPLDKGLLFEAESFAQVMGTADAKEGTSAFLQKRQPKFQDK